MLLETLRTVAPDPLLKIIGEFRGDKRTDKIDLGVGVYCTEKGHTPVLDAVKKAEQILVNGQETKSYVGLSGDMDFVRLLGELTFGKDASDSDRFLGMQTPGGSAALRLAAELVKRGNPDASIWIGMPCWSNHIPIFEAAGLSIKPYNYYNPQSSTVEFDTVITALKKAKTGDAVLLQACCHNPTGADFTAGQWNDIASICEQNGLIPLLDLAYQGFGDGLEEDAAQLRKLMDTLPEAIIAVSCSKNFGLYRERTGAVFVLAHTAQHKETARSNLFVSARPSYSMPPAHGAEVVRTILSDSELTSIWKDELTRMRSRIQSVRQHLSSTEIGAGLDLSYLANQRGMFALLPLSPEDVVTLKRENAIYMSGEGRINLAGLNPHNIDRFMGALRAL